MKAGIIGCGQMGYAHAQAYTANNIDIVCAVDTNENKALKFSKRFNCNFYTSQRRMMEEQELDVISICTPVDYHRVSIEMAIKNGIPILCEKPFAIDLDEAISVGKLIAKSNAFFSIGFKMRYENIYREAKTILDSNEIGEAINIIIGHFQPPPSASWYMDNGVIMELLVHSIDICNWFFNSIPYKVTADAQNILNKRGEDRAFIKLDYQGHNQGIIVGGYIDKFPAIAGKDDFLFLVVGEAGYLAGKRNGKLLVCSKQRLTEIELEKSNAFELEIKDFIESINQKQTPKIPLKVALASQLVLNYVYKSINEDLPVTVKIPEDIKPFLEIK